MKPLHAASFCWWKTVDIENVLRSTKMHFPLDIRSLPLSKPLGDEGEKVCVFCQQKFTNPPRSGAKRWAERKVCSWSCRNKLRRADFSAPLRMARLSEDGTLDFEIVNGQSPLDKAGVYGIINLVNQQVYVGSASRKLRFRRNDHWEFLDGNVHPNPHLQAAWTKYGKANFEFVVLEFFDGQTGIIEQEQFWMDRFAGYRGCYNCGPARCASIGTVHTEETKRKLSVAATRQMSSPSSREYVSEMM